MGLAAALVSVVSLPSICSAFQAAETASPTGAQAPEATPQNDDALRQLPGNRAWLAKPSEQAFEAVFKNVPHDPRNRDYPALLAKIAALCDSYPGSDAAYRCIFAVEQWAKMGVVPPEDSERFTALRERFNPAKARLKELSAQVTQAELARDARAIRRIISDLRQIAEQYPGTVSEFIALGEIASLYDSILEHQNSLTAADAFLSKYQYDAVDYPSADTSIPANMLLRARLISRTQSLDKGIASYLATAQLFQGRPQGLTALMEAGELTLKNRRENDSIDIFEQIVAEYSPQSDERVVVARFRIAEAHLKLGQADEAVSLLEKIATELPGTRWERESHDLINYARFGGAIAPIQEHAPSQGVIDTPVSTWKWISILLAANALFVLAVVAVAFRRRKRRQKT